MKPFPPPSDARCVDAPAVMGNSPSMLFEIEKAIDSLRHPGIRTNLLKLGRNAAPYYLSSSINVASPITLYWSINSICNLKCKMCDVGMNNQESPFWKNLRIERKLNEIDIGVFKSVIDEVAEDGPFIAINSTEPLMYKPLTQAIEHCRSRNLEIGITTGAYTLPQQAADLAEAGLNRLNVSIDGPREVHNYIRGREDSFERSLRGVELFLDASRHLGLKSEVYLNYTISSMNFARLTEFYSAVRHLPVTLNFVQSWYLDQAIVDEHNAQFGDAYPVTVACLGEFNDPKKVDVDALFDQMQSLKDQPNVHFLPFLSKEQLRRHYHQSRQDQHERSRCMAAYFFANILADGSVIPYTRCPSMNLGNINDESFRTIWNGKKMKEWRSFIKKHKKMPMCRKCDLVY